MKFGKDFVGVSCFGLVVNRKGEILLAKKKTRNYWSLPGGKLELMEQTKKCAEREVLEETGVKIKAEKLLCFEERIDKKNKEHWLAFYYKAKPISGKAMVKEPDKFEDVKWFNHARLPKNLSEYGWRISRLVFGNKAKKQS